MENHEKFIKNIKTLCKVKGISVKAMLVDCGLRQSLIYDIEKRNNTPLVDNVIKIAQYFDVSMDYLLGLKDE